MNRPERIKRILNEINDMPEFTRCLNPYITILRDIGDMNGIPEADEAADMLQDVAKIIRTI